MKPSAKTVYLDHSIVTYEPFWPATRTLFHKSDRQLVLSVWNLLEIAGATDLPQRARRIAFLEECGPVWIYDHTFVRRQELKRFLWPNVYGAAPPHLDVYATHLSQAWSVYTGPKLTIGTTMTSLVEDISKVSDIPALKQLAPTALAKLQSITKKTWKAKQAEVFASVMTGVIPDRRPDGRALTKDEQKKLVAYCWDNRAAFFQACPTFAVDNALCVMPVVAVAPCQCFSPEVSR